MRPQQPPPGWRPQGPPPGAFPPGGPPPAGQQQPPGSFQQPPGNFPQAPPGAFPPGPVPVGQAPRQGPPGVRPNPRPGFPGQFQQPQLQPAAAPAPGVAPPGAPARPAGPPARPVGPAGPGPRPTGPPGLGQGPGPGLAPGPGPGGLPNRPPSPGTRPMGPPAGIRGPPPLANSVGPQAVAAAAAAAGTAVAAPAPVAASQTTAAAASTPQGFPQGPAAPGLPARPLGGVPPGQNPLTAGMRPLQAQPFGQPGQPGQPGRPGQPFGPLSGQFGQPLGQPGVPGPARPGLPQAATAAVPPSASPFASSQPPARPPGGFAPPVGQPLAPGQPSQPGFPPGQPSQAAPSPLAAPPSSFPPQPFPPQQPFSQPPHRPPSPHRAAQLPPFAAGPPPPLVGASPLGPPGVKPPFGVGSPLTGPSPAAPPVPGMASLSLSGGGAPAGGGFGQAPLAPPSFGPPPPMGGQQQQPQQPPQQRQYPGAGGFMPPPPPPIGGQPLPPPGQQQQAPAGSTRPGPPYTGGQPAGGSSSRIDPSQIPRPQAPTSAFVFETRVNGAANVPPSATSTFVVRDTGNCSPRFMRSSLTQVPCSSDLLTTSAMPFLLLVQPLALQDPAEEPIQVVNFGEIGPVRCGRCKAYINPFFRFVDQGRRFICNLCAFTNETPHDYVCHLGPDGRRRDADERPELCRGAVEFEAPKEYMVRDPMPPVFFFVLDVSLTALQSGAVAAACAAIKRVLSDLPEGDRTMVGFATFNSTIHFYSLNPSLQQPTMLVVPDVNDVYTPLPTDIVVPLTQAKDRLEQLLDNIPTMFASSRVSDSCFFAAATGAFLAIKRTGGKILAFQSVLPSIGISSLSSREAEGRANTANEKEQTKFLQPGDKNLKSLASDFADLQVSVDIFVTSQSFVDVASLSVLPKTTGGQLYLYSPFSAAHDTGKLLNDLRWCATRPLAMEAIMKVRTSTGLSVVDYHGNFHRRIPAEIYLPAMDSDKTVMALIKHDDKLIENIEACLQCAILYTTTSGHRRIRVLTLSLPTTTSLAAVFRGADLDAQVAFFLKRAASDATTQSMQSIREAAISSCINILFSYRKFCATASSSGQLILPEALKLLPLYTLALTKSIGLRVDAKLDERSYWLQKARWLSASLAVPFIYPRMYPLHSLFTKEGEELIQANGVDPSSSHEPLPPVLALSSEKLESDGFFLVENGEDALLWLAKGASPDLVFQVLGVRSFEEVSPGLFNLQEFDNKRSKKINAIVNEIRRQRCSYLRLRMLKRGDPSENIFFQQLVEDRTPTGMSYVEFLVYVHRQIQSKMS